MVKASTRQEIENALALEAAIRSEIRNLSVNLHETVAEISGGGGGGEGGGHPAPETRGD